jgi:hypothetical protein
MEKVEIQKQQVIGWVIVVREDGDDSWKLENPILSRDCCFDAKQLHLDDNISGIILNKMETCTDSGRHYALVGILRPGDDFSDEYSLPSVQDELSWQGIACRRVTINNQANTPLELFQLVKS